jgi:hypothetical protein
VGARPRVAGVHAVVCHGSAREWTHQHRRHGRYRICSLAIMRLHWPRWSTSPTGVASGRCLPRGASNT